MKRPIIQRNEFSKTQTARNKAEEWADNAEDVPVETDPDQFSAKHWAAKSQASSAAVDPQLIQARTGARQEANGMVNKAPGRATVANVATIRPRTNSFFVSCWFVGDGTASPTVGSGFPGILSMGRNVSGFPAGRTWQLSFRPATGALLFNARNEGVSMGSAQTNYPQFQNAGRVSHVVGVWDVQAVKVRLYIDGVLVEDDDISDLADFDNSSLDFTIGNAAAGNADNECQHGVFKEVIMGSFAPTDAEVLEMFRTGLPYRFKTGSWIPVSGDVQNGGSIRAFDSFSSDTESFNATVTGQSTASRNAGFLIDVVAGQRVRVNFNLVERSNFGGGTALSSSEPVAIALVDSLSSTTVRSNVSGITATLGPRSVILTATQTGTFALVWNALSNVSGDGVLDVDGIKITKDGAVIHLTPESLGIEPAQWRDVSGNNHHALLHTSGSFSKRRLETDKLIFRNVDATGGAFLGRNGNLAKAGVDVREIYIRNNGASNAVDLVIQYGDASNFTDMFTAFTLNAGEAITIFVTVPKPTGRDRYRVTGTSGVDDLTIELKRNNRGE